MIGIALQILDVGSRNYKKVRSAKEWVEAGSGLERWVLALLPLLTDLKRLADSDDLDESLKPQSIYCYERCSSLLDELKRCQGKYRQKGLCPRGIRARLAYPGIKKLKGESELAIKTLLQHYDLLKIGWVIPHGALLLFVKVVVWLIEKSTL